MKKRMLGFVFAIAMTVSCLLPARAAETTSLYLDTYRAWLTPKGNGVIDVCVDVQAVTYMDEVGASVIEMYESTDGGETWERDGTYVKSMHPQMVVEDDVWYYDVAIQHQGTAGNKYFAIVTAYAADETGSDEKDYQTYSVYAT